MASSFPGTLDSFATNRVDATPMVANHAADHNNYADAINTLERTFGPEVFSVINYGSTGNGSTDDTAAIQATIDAAEAYTIASMRGAVVYFPCGMYRTSAPLRVKRDNIILEGMGRTGTGVGTTSTESTVPVTGGTIIRPLPGFAGDWVIDVSHDSDPKVRALIGNWINNLSIDGYYIPAGTTGGIRFESFRGGMKYTAIMSTGTNGATGPVFEFRSVDDVTTWPKGVWDCLFHGCIFQGGGGVGFYVPGQSSDSIVSDCIIQDNDSYGMHIVGAGWQIHDSYITGNGNFGIYSEGREVQILDNRIRENVGGVKFAIAGVGWGANYMIVGNEFRNSSQGGDNVNDCIEISHTTSQTGGLITGNSVSTADDLGAYRPRYGVNITNANSVDLVLGPMGAGYATTARTSPFGTAEVNDLGTNTRHLRREKIHAITTNGTAVHITAEGKGNSTEARVSAVGKNAGGTVIGPMILQAGADGIGYVGATNNITWHLLQNSGARMTFTTGGDVSIADNVDVVLGTSTGSMLATAAAQKLGFWGAAPAIKPTAVADAAGGATIDTEARTALNALLARLRTIGIITT